jgi:hypothetical protein
MHARNLMAGLGALVGLVACEPVYDPGVGDEFYGTIDATVLDAKFLPATGNKCPPNTPKCYPAQRVSVQGRTTTVYNLGAVATGLTFGAGGTLAASTADDAAVAYGFNEGCVAQPTDEVSGIEHSAQFPVFSRLPLSTTSTTPVLPFVKVKFVTGSASSPCNAIKRNTSVEKGSYGVSATDLFAARVWPVIDPGAAVVPLREGSTFGAKYGWYKGLLLAYLDGGDLPRDDAGAVLTMEGVMVTPATGTASAPADNGVLVLPFDVGDPGFSPVLRVKKFTAAADRTVSSYTALCSSAAPDLSGLPACTAAPNEIDMATVPAAITHTIFIVASDL